MKNSEKELSAKIARRLESGEIANQPCWSFIKELNSGSPERLESVAIRDGYRTYTYSQMFRYWERYAEAFSGMKISSKHHSRVGLIGTPLTETVFAFYALNMTGASVSLIYPFDLFDEKQIHSMIEREKITDLVVSELYAFPQLMKRLLRDREMLGLRNIILLESPMGGDFGIPGLEIVRKMNREFFSELSGGFLMEDLLKKYETFPITYGSGKSQVVLHTTGTVSGMHKPVPMTDKAINAFVVSAIKALDSFKDFENLPKHLVTYLTLNMSWVYAMVDMLHAPLGLGMEIVSLPVGATNPRYSEAIEHYGINVLFTSKSILDSWLKTMPDIDLSKLKIVFMGGTYISPEYKKKFNDYLRSCGSTARIINGYGLSELGGACLLSPSDREDDAIGFLLPGFKAKIFVEDENRYQDISDGPGTGILFLNSPTMSTGRLDDTEFFSLDTIDKEEYFNTNDLVRVNEDGSLTCIGRSNQFFVNNAGIRFDAGLIENAVTSQPGIVACGLAPEFHKTLHDNIPVLYVELAKSGDKGLDVLKNALVQVFIKDNRLKDTNMPSQCVITETVPLNSSGKVDAKKLASGTVTGSRYSVKPVREDDKVVDITLVPAAEGENATMGAGVPEELEDDPYTILSEVFAIIPELNEGHYTKLLHVPGLRDLLMKLTGFDLDNIPGSMGDMMPRLFTLAYNKYLQPFMKGVNKMGKKKKKDSFKSFMSMCQGMMPMMSMMPPLPLMPPFGFMPFMQGSDDEGKKKSDSNNWMETYWDQMIDMQRSTLEAIRDQWDSFFDHMMDMEDTFVDSLSDDDMSLPLQFFGQSFSVSPKKLAKWMKEFQETANMHFVEQADSFNDLVIKSQEQVKDIVCESKEEKEDESAKDDTKTEESAKTEDSKEEPAKTENSESIPIE